MLCFYINLLHEVSDRELDSAGRWLETYLVYPMFLNHCAWYGTDRDEMFAFIFGLESRASKEFVGCGEVKEAEAPKRLASSFAASHQTTLKVIFSSEHSFRGLAMTVRTEPCFVLNCIVFMHYTTLEIGF